MKLKELKIICNALTKYKRQCLEREKEPDWMDSYKDVRELENKYEKKLHDRTKYGYIVIRGRWSGYSGQSNCDRGERRSRCKKISSIAYNKGMYHGDHIQHFNDGTENYRTVNFEYDKPEVNNNLGGYEWRLRAQGLPV